LILTTHRNIPDLKIIVILAQGMFFFNESVKLPSHLELYPTFVCQILKFQVQKWEHLSVKTNPKIKIFAISIKI